MADDIRGSRDYQFRIGQTDMFVGPQGTGRRRPILAIKGPDAEDVAIVAEFTNSTAAELFVRSLVGAAGMQLPAPDLSETEWAEVIRFEMQRPLTGAEARAEREALEQVDAVEPFIDWFTETVVS